MIERMYFTSVSVYHSILKAKIIVHPVMWINYCQHIHFTRQQFLEMTAALDFNMYPKGIYD